MFNKIRAFFLKKKVDRMKLEAEKIYMLSHILLVLYNNTKIMRTLDDKQRIDVFNAYVKTLYGTMTDVDRVLFTQAAAETNKAIDQISKNIPINEIQIKRQLDEIFRSAR